MSAAIWVIIGVVLAWLLNFLYEERKFHRQLIVERNAKFIEKREKRLDEINAFVRKLASQFSEYRKLCFRIINQDIANTMNALESLSRASEDFQFERIINTPSIYSLNSPELNQRWDAVSTSFSRIFSLNYKIHQAYEKNHLKDGNATLEQDITDIENNFVNSLSQFLSQLDQIGFEAVEERKMLPSVGEMIGRLRK